MIAFIQADACRLPLADKSVDLVFGSPPYADARSYGIGAQRGCQAWIDWMVKVTAEACRVSRGLVLWVCAGVTRKHCYWPGPEGLLYSWWAAGGQCWRPCFWHRVGIPGSGGKQWLRADIEYVLAFKGESGPLPWSDNTANGHKPKWAPGGEMSYRDADGNRLNGWHSQFAGGNGARGQGRNAKGEKCVKDRLLSGRDKWGGTTEENRQGGEGRNADGTRKTRNGKQITCRISCGKGPDGDTRQDDVYIPPVLANPGCLVKGIKVGGGLMGHPLAHENEAPFPQKLADWFITSWCPPGGTVLDSFSGSGTTVAAAASLGRHGIGCDLRQSQCDLGRRRCAELQKVLF